jgi:hypothetical protein
VSAFKGGYEQWPFTVSAMDANETTGNWCSMDAVMAYDKEVVHKQWQRLSSMAAAAAGN